MREEGMKRLFCGACVGALFGGLCYLYVANGGGGWTDSKEERFFLLFWAGLAGFLGAAFADKEA